MTGAAKTQDAGRPALRDGERHYFLNPSGPTVIGRQSCAILLRGDNVAPKHARVVPSRGSFFLEPLGGEVLVNGARLNRNLSGLALAMDKDVVHVVGEQILDGLTPQNTAACVQETLRAADSLGDLLKGEFSGSSFWSPG